MHDYQELAIINLISILIGRQAILPNLPWFNLTEFPGTDFLAQFDLRVFCSPSKSFVEDFQIQARTTKKRILVQKLKTRL